MRKIYLVLIVLFLTGCATPAQRFAAAATDYGFIGSNIAGQLFQHRFYSNRLAEQMPKEQALHVYIDGDGTPWEHESWPAEDPTSRNPLILNMMVQDKTASILLGRPCYHGLNTIAACEESFWTSRRYAQEVVDSMAVALNRWLEKHPFKKVVLIGYSGGGSLAVLMAEKIPQVSTVVTFSANLDVDEWSKAHGYPTLNESLNPIAQKILPKRIKQLHLAGADDDVVPAYIVKSYADQQNADFRVYPEFDHQCCWEKAWQNILPLF
jgi:pimeloyl-ACP methyl ester carboxylesterase